MFLRIFSQQKNFVRNFNIIKPTLKTAIGLKRFNVLQEVILTLKHAKVEQIFNFCKEHHPDLFKSKTDLKKVLKGLHNRKILRTYQPPNDYNHHFEFTQVGKRRFEKIKLKYLNTTKPSSSEPQTTEKLENQVQPPQ